MSSEVIKDKIFMIKNILEEKVIENEFLNLYNEDILYISQELDKLIVEYMSYNKE